MGRGRSAMMRSGSSRREIPSRSPLPQGCCDAPHALLRCSLMLMPSCQMVISNIHHNYMETDCWLVQRYLAGLSYHGERKHQKHHFQPPHQQQLAPPAAPENPRLSHPNCNSPNDDHISAHRNSRLASGGPPGRWKKVNQKVNPSSLARLVSTHLRKQNV